MPRSPASDTTPDATLDAPDEAVDAALAGIGAVAVAFVLALAIYSRVISVPRFAARNYALGNIHHTDGETIERPWVLSRPMPPALFLPTGPRLLIQELCAAERHWERARHAHIRQTLRTTVGPAMQDRAAVVRRRIELKLFRLHALLQSLHAPPVVPRARRLRRAATDGEAEPIV
ncbi:hypothetical protein B0H11DRAFT_1942047 [Mycena galericulata]|nr:hypothetical protein B0H11DRAFT_1942047 [Mycena galericulata]